MNRDKFLERWQQAGVSKQLAVLLACLVKRQERGEVSIAMSELDDILAGGQNVVSRYDGDSIRLLFSGEFTTIYSIEESIHERSPSWATQQNRSEASYSGVKTDEELAMIEENLQRKRDLESTARQLRTQPFTTSPKKTNHKRPLEEQQ